MTELDRLGWVVSRAYAIGGLGFGVRTTSKEFGVWLDRALHAYRVENEDARPHYSIVVADGAGDRKRRKETYHALYRGTLAIAKTPDLRTMVRTLFSDLESFLYEERDDAIYVDMVPLSLGGATGLVPAVLMPFVATLGRRRIARSGLSLPAETAVAVDPGSGRILPMRPMVEVADRTLDSLAEVFPLNADDDRTMVEAPLSVDVVFSIGWGDEPLEPISRGLALYRLATHAANLEHLGVAAVEGLRKLVQPARTYELGSGKPAKMLEGLVNGLGSG